MRKSTIKKRIANRKVIDILSTADRASNISECQHLKVSDHKFRLLDNV